MSRTNLAILCLSLLALLAATGCQKEQDTLQFTEMEPGLSYADSVVGTGATASPGDYVVVHYTGYLYDPEDAGHNGHRGEKFDSSRDPDRLEPIVFPLGRHLVIPGWDKGLVGMKVGGKRTLVIGPDLAYGEQGRPPVIPGSSTLIFDTELMDVPKVQIEVLEPGDGPVAQVGDNVSVDYTGWLWENGAKGEQFDSSANSGRPFRFTIGRRMVIPGWDMAFEGMKVGEKARLIIPPVLGYGKQGHPGAIPPNATLCFEVELLSIEGK